MQCLTDLIYLLVVVESIFKSPQTALMLLYFQQSSELNYPAVEFLVPCQIANLSTPLCSRLWFLPKTNVFIFVIWVTWLCESYSTLGGLHWMYARSGLLPGIILEMPLCGDCIYTAELKTPAALASYVSFVIKFFATHQNIGPAQRVNIFWQKLTLQI